MAIIDFFSPVVHKAGQNQDQEAVGSTRAGGSLALGSTAHRTKGPVMAGALVYDEATGQFGNVPQPQAALHIAGRVRIDTAADSLGAFLEAQAVTLAPQGVPTAGILLECAGLRYLLPLVPLGGPPPAPGPPSAAITALPSTVERGNPVTLYLASSTPNSLTRIVSGRLQYDLTNPTAEEVVANPPAQLTRTNYYEAPGPGNSVYTARWTVTDNLGASASASCQITVTPVFVPPNQPPTAGISAAPTSGLAPLAVTLTFTCSDPDAGDHVASGHLNYGDGGPDEVVTNPAASFTRSHAYAAGSYLPSYWVTDSHGTNSQPVYQAITVNPSGPPPPPPNQPPTAGISAAPSVGVAPLTVTLTFTASDPDAGDSIASGHLDYGDGTTPEVVTSPAASFTRSHAYGAGIYLPSYWVTDSHGADSSTVYQAINVSAAPVNHPPTAGISAQPSTVASGQPVTLYLTSADPDSGDFIASGFVEYDLSNPAASETITRPQGTEQRVNYYTAPGPGNSVYTARYTATDSHGLTASATCPITVTPQPPPPPVKPAAGITAQPASGTAPLSVLFTLTSSTTDSLDSIASGRFDPGDGSAAQNFSAPASPLSVSHTYPSAGSFTASWTVTAARGLTSDPARATVAVSLPPNQPPVCSIAASPASGQTDLLVTLTFTNSDTDGTVASGVIHYDVGTPSATETVPSPLASFQRTHTYTVPAGQSTDKLYTATYQVTDNRGATSTVAQAQITVHPVPPPQRPPVATVSANPTSGPTPFAPTLTFTASSPDGAAISSGTITYGDGATETVTNPAASLTRTHAYSAVQNFTVGWSVTDSRGLSSTPAQTQISVTAAPPPAAVAIIYHFEDAPGLLIDSGAAHHDLTALSGAFADGIAVGPGQALECHHGDHAALSHLDGGAATLMGSALSVEFWGRYVGTTLAGYVALYFGDAVAQTFTEDTWCLMLHADTQTLEARRDVAGGGAITYIQQPGVYDPDLPDIRDDRPWNHYCWTFQGQVGSVPGRHRLYVNAVMVNETPTSLATLLQTPGTPENWGLAIAANPGGLSGGDIFAFDLDDTVVSNRELLDTEVSDHYENGVLP